MTRGAAASSDHEGFSLKQGLMGSAREQVEQLGAEGFSPTVDPADVTVIAVAGPVERGLRSLAGLS